MTILVGSSFNADVIMAQVLQEMIVAHFLREMLALISIPNDSCGTNHLRQNDETYLEGDNCDEGLGGNDHDAISQRDDCIKNLTIDSYNVDLVGGCCANLMGDIFGTCFEGDVCGARFKGDDCSTTLEKDD